MAFSYPFFTTTLDKGFCSASNPFGSLQVTTRISEDSWKAMQEETRKRMLAECVRRNEQQLMQQCDPTTPWQDAYNYQYYGDPSAYYRTYRRPEVEMFEPPRNSYPVTFRQELQEFINNWLKGISI